MGRYEKIADDLRSKVLAGTLRPGQKMPAETALAAEYKVSLPTLRQALGVLEAGGLIEKQHGRGNFVRAQRHRAVRNNERHQWEKNRARGTEAERARTGATEHDTGLTVDDLTFSAEYREISAPEDLAEKFGVPVGTRLLQRIYRTRKRDEDRPFNVARSYLLYDQAKANPDLLNADKEPWPGGTQSQLYTLGIELDRIVEHVTARPPLPEESDELGIIPGVSVIALRKTSIDTSDRVVEVSDVVLPGDRTEVLYTTRLDRW